MASMPDCLARGRRAAFTTGLLVLGMLGPSVACSKAREALPADDGAASDDEDESDAGPAKREPVAACPDSNPFCKRDAAPALPSCATVPVDLTPVGVNVMVAV